MDWRRFAVLVIAWMGALLCWWSNGLEKVCCVGDCVDGSFAVLVIKWIGEGLLRWWSRGWELCCVGDQMDWRRFAALVIAWMGALLCWWSNGLEKVCCCWGEAAFSPWKQICHAASIPPRIAKYPTPSRDVVIILNNQKKPLALQSAQWCKITGLERSFKFWLKHSENHSLCF